MPFEAILGPNPVSPIRVNVCSQFKADRVLDNGYLPHFLIRMGIRRQLAERLIEISTQSLEMSYQNKMSFISKLRTQPIAIETDAANEQHYEVGTDVMARFIGSRMKYSSCLYPQQSTSLDEAEVAMLELCVERAEIKDGMSILDMGCGWGSMALFMAERFPSSQITALSNSRTQKLYIDQQAKIMGLQNIHTITADICDYQFTEQRFDRIVAIESFEHMKNYKLLLSKLASSLKPLGKLFVHIFAHKDTPYHFEEGWMSRNFFTGGTMPSADLLLFFQEDLKLQNQWWVSGMHYARTCEDWLSKMIKTRQSVWPHLIETYGHDRAQIWYNRWQIFFLACAELFAYNRGDTWGVCHYLFEKPTN